MVKPIKFIERLPRNAVRGIVHETVAIRRKGTVVAIKIVYKTRVQVAKKGWDYEPFPRVEELRQTATKKPFEILTTSEYDKLPPLRWPSQEVAKHKNVAAQAGA